jgi:hypothetical protein
MALEERLVAAHALDSHNALAELHLQDAVNEHKRVTVRDDSLNIGGFEHV